MDNSEFNKINDSKRKIEEIKKNLEKLNFKNTMDIEKYRQINSDNHKLIKEINNNNLKNRIEEIRKEIHQVNENNNNLNLDQAKKIDELNNLKYSIESKLQDKENNFKLKEENLKKEINNLREKNQILESQKQEV